MVVHSKNQKWTNTQVNTSGRKQTIPVLQLQTHVLTSLPSGNVKKQPRLRIINKLLRILCYFYSKQNQMQETSRSKIPQHGMFNSWLYE